MKKISIYLLTLLTAFAVSCSESEPEVAPGTNNTSVDNGARKSATNTKKAISQNIAGNIAGVSYTGTFRINKFTEKNGLVYAVGYITNIAFPAGTPADNILAVAAQLQATQVSVQVKQARVDGASYTAVPTTQASQEAVFKMVSAMATCQVLDLVLGPLDLNLLGLVVHLDQVVLTIDAIAGGGLLGDLLCLVANLLSGGLLLGELLDFVNLLNAIIDLIGAF
jgi:hypothetical protein